MTLSIDSQASASLVVGPADLASTHAQRAPDAFPQVFATARMVALMETAAARLLHPLLQPGQLSVGVHIAVSHTAPTPPGVEVVAEATFTGMEGKRYCFDVVARDAGGEVGRGTHQRAIVDAARLEAGAAERCGG